MWLQMWKPCCWAFSTHLPPLKFSESGMMSSKAILNKVVTHVDVSVRKPMLNRRKAVQWIKLILGLNIPWGMAKRSIPSLSPSSLLVKTYIVFMIPNPKWGCYNEGHKVTFCQPSFSLSYLIFGHVIYMSKTKLFTVVCSSYCNYFHPLVSTQSHLCRPILDYTKGGRPGGSSG